MKTRLAARNEERPAGVDEARAFRRAMKIAPYGARMKNEEDRRSRGVKRKRNSEHGARCCHLRNYLSPPFSTGFRYYFQHARRFRSPAVAGSLHAPAIGLIALTGLL